MVLAKRSATYQDVLDAPEHMVAEIIDGDLHLSPRPAKPHAICASILGMDLGSAFQRKKGGPGGWWIVDEPEIHLGRHVLVPDLAGWRKSEMPSMDLATAYFTEPPAWVCEVLSPSTERTDRVQKLRIYGEHGVKYAWLLHPINHTLEVFRRDEAWSLIGAHAGDVMVRAEPFGAIELELGALWLGE